MVNYAELKKEVSSLIQGAPDSDGVYVRAADLVEGIDFQDLPEFRLAILRSFTIEPLVEILKVKFFLDGFRLELFLSEFNQYQQEILDPSSKFYRFKPRVTFLAVRLEDLCPQLFNAFAHLTPDNLKGLQNQVLQKISGWVAGIDSQCATEIFLSNFIVPASGALGLYDTQTPFGQVSAVRSLNAELVRLCEGFSKLHVFDLELLAARIGKQTFCDPLQQYRMSNPYRLSAYPSYGEYLMSHIRALLGRRRKCLVLDLDGTLWGGIVGEDGLTGIELSDTYPGNCFKDFQRAIMQLHQRGIILAVNSKNNYEDGIQVIRSHPGMILREEHFSAIRINWKDKVENLYDIASELNIGLESLVFIDDNAVECERVRQACPEVLVVHLPSQKHTYRTLVENMTCFEQLSMTSEDRLRGELYRGQSKRQQLAAQASSLEEFLASLEMRGVMYRNERSHITRIAQMTQKTNQFNLTTKRYTDGEILRFMEQGVVYSLQIEDHFGDNGIVAAAIVVPSGNGRWCIDTFLMSCRVIMRTVEDTLIAQIAEDARAMGGKRLIGVYVPTQKNQMVEEFYPRHGFTLRPSEESGGAEHALDLSDGMPLKPSPWIGLIQKGELRR